MNLENALPHPSLAEPSRIVCVFASSSGRIAAHWHDDARNLGAALAHHGFGLAYGGCDLGLMGTAAWSAREAGCPVLGVIPQALEELGEADRACEELVVVPDLPARKRVLIQRSGSFLCLPGGIGTYDEIFEVLALRQVGESKAPLVLVNDRGFYNPLLHLLATARDQRFIRGLIQSGESDPAVLVASTTAEAVHQLAVALK